MKYLIYLYMVTFYTFTQAVEFVTYEKANDSYVCLAVDATGFSYSEKIKDWQSTRFNVKNAKYLLHKRDEGWGWKEFHTQISTFCPNLNKNDSRIGFISCKTLHGSFNLNLNTLKYVKASTSGYSNNDTDNLYQPYIEIGTYTAL